LDAISVSPPRHSPSHPWPIPNPRPRLRSCVRAAYRKPPRPLKQQQSEPVGCICNRIRLMRDSFIKEQLSLEAEAREALPYVSAAPQSHALQLTPNSNLTHAHATSVPFVRVSTPALHATRRLRVLRNSTLLLASATPAPSPAMANTPLLSSSTNATLSAIAAQREHQIMRPVHCA
jgi:hypothetical protein